MGTRYLLLLVSNIVRVWSTELQTPTIISEEYPGGCGFGFGQGGGGVLFRIPVGVCCPVLQILTLFQTKTCHFPQPFSDLACKIHTRFQTFVVA